MTNIGFTTKKNVERVKKSDMAEEIKYDMAGLFSSRGEWRHPCRLMSTYEYIFMTEGNAYIEEEGKQYTLKAGDLLLLEPERQHEGFDVSRERVSFYWIHFYGDVDVKKLPKYIRPECAPRLLVLFRQLLHYSNSGDYPRVASDCTVRLILSELEREFSKRENPTPSLYEQICEWCRTNSDRKLTATEVADRFGYNKDYLNRMFTRYGRGLKEYINDRRMDTIRAKLLSDGLTLKEIARQTGFDDYKDFLKYFRYHEGITPTEFRNLYYKTHTNNR